MILTTLHLLPAAALAVCAYEDLQTRRVSGASLAVLAASYIPVGICAWEAGIYAAPAFWVLAAAQIAVWFCLLVYGFITGRGGADRVVILTGAATFAGFFAMITGFIIWGLSSLVLKCSRIKIEKFPYIVPYFLGYVLWALSLILQG